MGKMLYINSLCFPNGTLGKKKKKIAPLAKSKHTRKRLTVPQHRKRHALF